MENLYSGKDPGDVLLLDASKGGIQKHLSYEVRVRRFLMGGSFGVSTWNNPFHVNALIYNYMFIFKNIVSIGIISRIDLDIQSMDVLGSQKQMMIEYKDGDDVYLQESVLSVSGGEGAIVPHTIITSLPGANHNENNSCSNFFQDYRESTRILQLLYLEIFLFYHIASSHRAHLVPM